MLGLGRYLDICEGLYLLAFSYSILLLSDLASFRSNSAIFICIEDITLFSLLMVIRDSLAELSPFSSTALINFFLFLIFSSCKKNLVCTFFFLNSKASFFCLSAYLTVNLAKFSQILPSIEDLAYSSEFVNTTTFLIDFPR